MENLDKSGFLCARTERRTGAIGRRYQPKVPAVNTDQMDLLAPAKSAVEEAYNYRMLGDRRLAKRWSERAVDNIKAILLSAKIEQEGRPATEVEQALMAKFVGFGASELAQSLFPGEKRAVRKGWENIGLALRKSVSSADMAELARATQYAHYTPEYIVKAMWKGLKRLGFTGGKVLEPGMGTGLFFALMPESIAGNSKLVGIERDPTTARIARLLYPESDIIRGDFRTVDLDSGFDLAIGNPPYSRLKVDGKDPTGKLGLSLHDYFIARSIHQLRPGGIGAFVVSRFFMDKVNLTARRHIACMADLVGAIRMPEGAMSADAGTSVLADIVFFQRRDDSEKIFADPEWVQMAESPVVIEGKPVWINKHFVNHPEFVLGTQSSRTSEKGPVYTVAKSGDVDVMLAEAIGRLPQGIYTAPTMSLEEAVEAVIVKAGPTVRVGTAAEGATVKEGSYIVDTADRDRRRAALYEAADSTKDKAERKRLLREAAKAGEERGTLYQIIDGKPELVAIRAGKGTKGIFGKHAGLICDMVPIKEALHALLEAQENDQDWREAQIKLNAAYDVFVRHHGPINDTSISESVAKDSIPLFNALLAIRTAEAEINAAEAAGEPVHDRKVAWAASVDEFEREHGPLAEAEDKIETRESYRYPNLAPFRDDPDAWLVASCVDYDQATNVETKGPIFTRRVQQPRSLSVESAGDALALALNETGKVDMPRIAELLGKTEDEAIKALRDLIYLDPETEQWTTADEYLSGLVRDKLSAARAAAKRDPQFERNVTALEDVQPIDIPHSDITARLGAPFIPADVISEFCREIMGINAEIRHTPSLGIWSVPVERFAGAASARVDWGTERRHAGLLLQDALTGNAPKIFDYVDNGNGGKKAVLNEKETQAANDKLTNIKEAFVAWVWQNPERADRLATIYNRDFNNIAPRQFDGSHLVMPGISSVFTIRPHQKRVAWRMICTGDAYVAHEVGAGKTIALVIAIMEQRRLGLINKPMIVVPSHTLAQWSREWLALYPRASILVADEENFAADKRHRFVARAAFGNWDAIIITDSAFKLLAAPKQFEEDMIRRWIDEFEEALTTVEDGDDITRKKIEAAKESFEKKLVDLSDTNTDDMITIDEIGIDFIGLDEAHSVRKLEFVTSMSSLKGIDPKGSKTSWGMYVKAEFLRNKFQRKDRHLVMMSGTPITNTMGELFTLLRYLHRMGLVAKNVQHFDAWISMFGETKADLELQPSGDYKPVTRMAEFVNIPELSAMFLHCADVILGDDLAEFVKLPALLGGKRKVMPFPGGQAFKDFQAVLAARIKNIEDRGGRPEPGDDIILSVYTDGVLAAIDLRLVNVNKALDFATNGAAKQMRAKGEQHPLDTDALRAAKRENNPENKLNGLIDNALRIYRETSENRYINPTTGEEYPTPGAAQMIFCDLGTLEHGKKHGFSAYSWIRRRLIEGGVPEREIAIIQNYKKMQQKQRLFNEVNAGRVRFLIGSSDTMGTGVNAQLRLKALHHLDAGAYLPAKIKQREGRIVRQGNQNEEVEVYVYVTLGSMDATLWQILERKMRFIDAVMRGDKSVRRLKDMDEAEADMFAMAKALASGDTRLMRKAGLEAEIARMKRQRSAYYDAQSGVRTKIRWAHETIAQAEDRIRLLKLDLDQRSLPDAENFRIVIEGKEHTNRDEAANELMKAINTALTESKEKQWVLAEYAGFTIEAEAWERRSVAGRYDADIKTEFVVYAWMLCQNKRTRVFEMDYRTGEGVIGNIERHLRALEADLEKEEFTVQSARQTIADWTKKLSDAKWDQQAILDQKLEELAEIEASLMSKKEEEKKEKENKVEPVKEAA